MTPRKFSEIVPEAMSELTRMIEKGERESPGKRVSVIAERSAIRVTRNAQGN